MSFGEKAFSLKARSMGFSHLSDPWMPGVYVSMSPAICKGWVTAAPPIGEKCKGVIDIVDAAIFKMMFEGTNERPV